MKSKMLGLRTVIYSVENLKEATEWYSRLFGTKPYFNDTSYVGFDIGGYELGLIPEKKVLKNKQANVLAYWGVEDVVAKYEEFLKEGAVEFEKPHNVGGEILVSAVKDPWGNAVGLIYNPGFKPK